jgi:hypothetical protein
MKRKFTIIDMIEVCSIGFISGAFIALAIAYLVV